MEGDEGWPPLRVGNPNHVILHRIRQESGKEKEVLLRPLLAHIRQTLRFVGFTSMHGGNVDTYLEPT